MTVAFRALVLSILLPAASISVSAQNNVSEHEILKEVMDNVSHEMTTCSAFYVMLAGATKKAGEEETAARFMLAFDNLIGMATASAKIGRSEEMATDVVRARLDIEVDQMKRKIGDYSNISLLISEHHKRCEAIYNDVDWLIVEWEKKIAEKYRG